MAHSQTVAKEGVSAVLKFIGAGDAVACLEKEEIDMDTFLTLSDADLLEIGGSVIANYVICLYSSFFFLVNRCYK